MAEYERPDFLRQGHLFDTSVVRRELWQLLLIFLADKALITMAEEIAHAGVTLGDLQAEFTEVEITRILMNSAIALRILDDRDGDVFQYHEPCGELEIKGQAAPLSLREACNKIVHASRVNFDVERLDGKPLDGSRGWPTFLRPTIYLYGNRQRGEWRAVLNVVAYVHGAIQVL